MNKLSLVVIVLGLLAFSSCETQLINCLKEEGDKEWREVSVESFKAVTFQDDVKVTFREGEQKVRIYSTPNVIDAIMENSSVSDEVWNTKVANCSRTSTIEYEITLPLLEGVDVSGSGDIFTEGTLSNTSFIDLTSSGSANFTMDFDNLERINISSSGSSEYTISGTTNTAYIDISGSGDIHNFDLIAETCNISSSGSVDCEVSVTADLKVDLSGSGSVCYKGNPNIQSDISGSGNINSCN